MSPPWQLRFDYGSRKCSALTISVKAEVSPSLIPGCRLVLFLTSHVCWHIYSKCSGVCVFLLLLFFIFELKMKDPQGNYAMGNSHFNKLDSHILLIMVNLIIPFKHCLHTKKPPPYLFPLNVFSCFHILSTDQKCTINYLKIFRGEISKLLPHNYKLKIRKHTINLIQNIFK